MLIDLTKTGFYEVENKLRKKLNLKDKINYNDDNIKIGKNTKNKTENKILKNSNHIIKNKIIIIIIILIKTIIQILPLNKNILLEFQFSNITLRIKGIGNKKQNVFSSINKFNITNYPNTVYINGKKKDTVTFNYYLNQSDNIVELIWNNSLSDCQHMFYQCSDIIEIDLSNFDASNCKSMWSMFNGCSKLASINLINFNTSKSRNNARYV